MSLQLTSYYPAENAKLRTKAQQALIHYTKPTQYGIGSLPKDIMEFVLSMLSLISLTNLSRSCKTFYALYLKPERWQQLFSRYLSITPSVQTSLSVERQFKLVHIQVNKTGDALEIQKQNLYDQLIRIRGLNGDDGLLYKTKKEASDLTAGFNRMSLEEKEKIIPTWKLLEKKGFDLTIQLFLLVGEKYDGTEQSIDPETRLGRVLSKMAENKRLSTHQEKFERFLTQYEVAEAKRKKWAQQLKTFLKKKILKKEV